MNQNSKDNQKGLRRISLITLLAIYVLVLVGGIVRSTGSGMGCPDWPKCFGQWVPPTSIDQLPDDYEQNYTDERMAKNTKFANYLSILGFTDKADELLRDESIQHETPFNVYKTWVEYINRVVGVIIGFLIILTVVVAFPHRKTQKHVFYVALASLFLVVFQGWLGSIVVSTNLLPWMVTVHMIPALVIVVMLIYLVVKSENYLEVIVFSKENRRINSMLSICIFLLFIQIILGTQVREAIDVIALQLTEVDRDSWISNLGLEFLIHRSFSWMIVISHGGLVYLLFKRRVIQLNSVYGGLIAMVLLSVGTGVVMAYLGIPAFIQPLHLLLAFILFGLQFWIFFKMNMQTDSSSNNGN
jgi:cytochrome c oxidase assembly protein subunit 15